MQRLPLFRLRADRMTLAFAAEQIELWPLARLQPYANNAKMHGDDQVAKIAASIVEFGWTAPCLVAEV